MIPGYELTLVFKLMFHSACASSSFSFRENMLHILEKVFIPWSYKFYCLSPFWLKGANYLYLEASQTAFLEYDLIRLAWMEKLKIVHLYLFIGTPNSEKEIITDKGLVLQNRWIYDQITKVIPNDRIAVVGRSHPPTTFGLPALPKIYQVLQAAGTPPKFQAVEWEKFHKDLQIALTEDLTSREF